MKNFELIAKLQALPPELDVALVDVRLNYIMQDPGGDIIPGVYDQMEVAQQNYEDGGHWISIMFVNSMIIINDEEGKKVTSFSRHMVDLFYLQILKNDSSRTL